MGRQPQRENCVLGPVSGVPSGVQVSSWRESCAVSEVKHYRDLRPVALLGAARLTLAGGGKASNLVSAGGASRICSA